METVNNQGGSQMEIETRQYEFSHGKKPRGYGSWAFFFDGNHDIDAAMFHTGKYSEACAFARAWARSKGFSRIEVGS
jgi:hypothetical protein